MNYPSVSSSYGTPGVALISGGGRGIGAAISAHLAAQGWQLFIVGRDKAALTAMQSSLHKEHQTNVTIYPCDLSRPGAAAEVFAACVAQAGVPSALICNAGNYGELGPFVENDFSRWAASFQLNFFASAELVHCALRQWLHSDDQNKTARIKAGEGKRKIVLMSGNGLGGAKLWPGTTSYGCAKAALYRLMEIVHAETHEQNITINCVAPGAVLSGMTQQALAAGPEALGGLYSDSLRQSQGQAGDSPNLAAELVAWLLSTEADEISGRLLSAKWDKALRQNAGFRASVSKDQTLYRLLRIDNELFTAKQG